MPTSAFATKLAGIAENEHTKFHLANEADPVLCSQIKKYWTGIGLAAQSCVKVPWSAVFVSWCVKQAGATASEFKFAAAHAVFVFQAIKNATNNTGVFRGMKITDHPPAVGDIIQNNRNGSKLSFDFAKAHNDYESHSAIVVETGTDSQGRYALTIGGNEGNSVRQTVVRLDNNGFIKQRTNNPYICVIKNMK